MLLSKEVAPKTTSNAFGRGVNLNYSFQWPLIKMDGNQTRI
jgi:hypothetical protein